LPSRSARSHPCATISRARSRCPALPFAGATLDAVVSVASLKHWPDQLKGLRECVRVLRPGGALAVAEADCGCRYDDAKAFVARWRILPPFRPVALAFSRTTVAGKALDLDEARELLAALPLAHRHVERIAGTPGLLMKGRALDAAPTARTTPATR
jgi:SAM-dependent methyltransferase